MAMAWPFTNVVTVVVLLFGTNDIKRVSDVSATVADWSILKFESTIA
jgi:hypothetical protein